jgi:hypothetical protein
MRTCPSCDGFKICLRCNGSREPNQEMNPTSRDHQTLIRMVTTFILSIGSIAATGADRPTTAAVAAAVAESYKAYLAEHPTLTQAEAVEAVKANIEKLEKERDQATRAADSNEKRDVRERFQSQIRMDAKRLEEIQTSYAPAPPPHPRLMPISFSSLKVGTVGRVTDDARRNAYGGHLRCREVLTPLRVLAIYRCYTATNAIARKVTTHDSLPFVLVGVDAAELKEDARIRLYLDVVVVGECSYETAGGTMATVPVLEVFDADKPFH